MDTMYPAIANSPITNLTESISETVSTIPVADATKLPAAPNIAVIGTGAGVETVLYTGKTDNNLTGCTRGFQGIAQIWPSTTPVARYFTAYDHDSFINNINTLAASIAHSFIADYFLDIGAADAYAITAVPAIEEYAAGQLFAIKIAHVNTGAATLNVCGKGAIALKKKFNKDLAAGDLPAGLIIIVVNEGTYFQIISALPSLTILPFTGTFNSTTGSTITHNLNVTAANYNVKVTPTSTVVDGTLGDIWVEKDLNTVVVKCSGTNTTATFDLLITAGQY